ncbi:MAG: type II and III secretion system protein, partial [Bacteroidota bacterium]
ESAYKMVTIFIQKVPFENAADKLAYAAGLQLSKTPDGVYVLEKLESQVQEKSAKAKGILTSRGRGLKGDNGIDVVRLENGKISVAADNVGIAQLMDAVSKEAGVHYLMYTVPKGETSLFMENISYNEFLDHLLTGSNLTYRIQDSIYLVGERNFEGLRSTELVRLENRTIQQVKESIPAELKKEVELFEFKELNGLVLSGSRPKIAEMKAFIRQIDQVVPLITIDVMIVDINSSRTTETGLTFGLGDGTQNTTTTGNTQGGININMNSRSVNQILNAFNGFGSINLGRVTPNFYMSLRALESEGIVKTRSTPRLSTLNGNEATLSIGETTYYLEVSNNLIGTQNPAVATSQNYKSVNADLTVTINPVVSGDDQVTLSIEVNQSDFTGKKINENAPPGTVTRKFKSIIRVKNEEMVILGGLENNRLERSGSGLPFINRIPVIKYLFGSRRNVKSKSKLTIFIKPTIHY